jgi:hypothetical protein
MWLHSSRPVEVKARNQKMKKTVCSILMAGGLIGTQAHAAVTTPASIPNRVAAVRSEINKRVAEAKDLGGLEAVTKLPYAQMELASWLNWVNWSNWNNWRNWNNWSNWQNWLNF